MPRMPTTAQGRACVAPPSAYAIWTEWVLRGSTADSKDELAALQPQRALRLAVLDIAVPTAGK